MPSESKYSYLRCEWLHDNKDEPVLLYSELDRDQFETRKLEYFRDGSIGFADGKRSTNGTMLGVVEVPPISEINSDAEFRASVASKEDFEERWTKAQ